MQVGNEINHLGAVALEQKYGQERRWQRVLFTLTEIALGFMFLGMITVFFLALQ